MSWKPSPSESKQQSFDGELWYGLTVNSSGSFGSIYANPSVTLGLDLDDDLAKQAAGGFFFRLDTLLDSPFNIGAGSSLLQAITESAESYRASLTGDSTTVTLSRIKVDKRMLPSSITFQMKGDAFYPTGMLLQSGATRVSSRFFDYKQLKGIYYPSRIEERYESTTKDKGLSTLMVVSYEIDASETTIRGNDQFQIAFPPGVVVFDDRQSRQSRFRKIGEPTWKSFGAIIGVCVLVVIGAVLFWRSRSLRPYAK